MNDQARTQAVFLTTRWSVVAQAGGDTPEARRALEELCESCWFPLYAYARRSGQSPADAQDLVQGFFAEVIEKDLFGRVDSEKGRLRTFLLTAFKRHSNHVARAAIALKRGGGVQTISFDEVDAEAWYGEQAREGESAENMYDRQWAMTILESVVEELGKDWSRRKKGDLFRRLRPFLSRQPEPNEYGLLETELEMTHVALKSAVHRLRAQYRERLISKVKETQLDDESHEDEMRVLMAALG